MRKWLLQFFTIKSRKKLKKNKKNALKQLNKKIQLSFQTISKKPKNKRFFTDIADFSYFKDSQMAKDQPNATSIQTSTQVKTRFNLKVDQHKCEIDRVKETIKFSV